MSRPFSFKSLLVLLFICHLVNAYYFRFSLTAHIVRADFSRALIVLRALPMDSRKHTADNLLAYFKEMLATFGLDEDDVSLTNMILDNVLFY